MGIDYRTYYINAACLTFLATALAGCATGKSARIVEPGDRVGAHFTCRLQNGDIVASTRKEINESPIPKSAIFMKRNLDDAVVVEAGAPLTPQRKPFEEEIMSQLAGALVGMKEGDAVTLDISAERIAGLPREEQFTTVNRVRKREKELKMSVEEYKRLTRKEPAVDQRVVIDPLVPGKVVGLSGNEVVIRFSAQADAEVSLPFGKGVIKEKEDRYEIEINAVKGSLVRVGGLVGCVAAVDADLITLDFGHPFGSEVLNCDVKIDSVQPGIKKEAAGRDGYRD